MTGFVYFVTCRALDRVKIGFSNNPKFRFSKMQTDSPVRLALEAEMPGDVAAEAELHVRFAQYRLHGEWFFLVSDIAALIESLKAPPAPEPSLVVTAVGHDLSDAELIDAIGCSALARAMESPVSTVHSWKRNGIPASRRAHIELLLQPSSHAQLDDFMKAREMSDSDLAAVVGRDRSIISKIRRGLLKPTLDVASAIETATEGEVPMQSWVSPSEAA